MKKSHALVIGATGATGRELVQLLLKDDDISQVTIFVRTAPTIKHEKLTIHEINFKKLCLVNVKEYIPEKNQTPALLDKKHLYVRTGNRTDEILGIDKIAEFTANRIK